MAHWIQRQAVTTKKSQDSQQPEQALSPQSVNTSLNLLTMRFEKHKLCMLAMKISVSNTGTGAKFKQTRRRSSSY